MPIYEYQCDACRHHLEALQKISDAPLRKCPQCGKTKLRRLISPPVFRLKGSGWYETDFKSDKENRRNLAVEKDEGPSATDSTAKPAGKDKKDGEQKKTGSDTASAASAPVAKPAAKPSVAASRKKAAPRSGKRTRPSARR